MANINNRSWPRNNYSRIIAERTNENSSPLAVALLNVTDAVKKWQPGIRTYFLGDTGPYSVVNEKQMEDYLIQVEEAWNQGVDEVCSIESKADEFSINIFFNYEDTAVGRLEHCWFSFPENLPADNFTVQQTAQLVKDVALGFGAFHCIIEDEDLLMLYRGKRSAARAMENVPEELRKYIPQPPAPDVWLTDFPELLVPQEFNRRKVADAVWSINYWDAEQVSTVGRERIYNAGWAQIDELENDSLLLLSVGEFINIKDVVHLEKLASIIRNISLYDLQYHYRLLTR